MARRKRRTRRTRRPRRKSRRRRVRRNAGGGMLLWAALGVGAYFLLKGKSAQAAVPAHLMPDVLDALPSIPDPHSDPYDPHDPGDGIVDINPVEGFSGRYGYWPPRGWQY